ncbi:hypothetical protein BH20ACI4_BH20ACI4_07580 [soil metagenome]
MADTFNNNGFDILTTASTRKAGIDERVFGVKVGIFAKLFGCEHKNISRPFTAGGTGYRTCLQCGARKQFDSETLKTYGSFYYPPMIRSEIYW